jgi:hypothetical protein
MFMGLKVYTLSLQKETWIWAPDTREVRVVCRNGTYGSIIFISFDHAATRHGDQPV